MYSQTVAKLFSKVPGKALRHYRFLPVFFVLGGLLEFSMIKWEVNGVNFYKTFKKTQVHKEALRQIEFEKARLAHEEKLRKEKEGQLL